MKLAFDVDDVILDFGGRVIETVNREYDAGLTVEDIKGWNLNELLDDILGEDWWLWWEERAWLWAKANAIPGAIGGLRKLHRLGHSIHLVTAKPDWARAGLNQWMGKWQPYYDHLHVGPARPPMVKHEWCGAELLVDDKPQNCDEWIAAGRPALLFNRPHNVLETSQDAPRVDNWHEIVYTIERYARSQRLEVVS